MMRHEPILIIAILAAPASVYIIKDKLSEAWALNTSAYIYTRRQTDEWFTLHQVLNRVAMLPPAIGFATLLAGNRSRYFVNVVRRYTWPGYIALFLAMAAFTFVLGNKNEVFMSLIAGLLAYLASVRRPSFLEGGPATGRWNVVPLHDRFFPRHAHFRDEGSAHPASGRRHRRRQLCHLQQRSLRSAFFPLRCAGRRRRAPVRLQHLFAGVLGGPARVVAGTTGDIYNYYADSVGAIQNQGYSIHHATGWYLNFGYTGIALGAVVMGLVWAWCLNAHQRIVPRSGLAFRLFATISPWLFVACLPPLIRAGPEGYKGFIDGVLIPMAVPLACRPEEAEVEAPVGCADGMDDRRIAVCEERSSSSTAERSEAGRRDWCRD